MRRKLVSALTTAALLASLALVALGAPALAVAGAGFTTDDPNYTDGNGYVNQECFNGGNHTTPAVDCNVYGDKRDVWINGGPSNGANQLTDGSYFFAVLVPGGQPDPNDGGLKNLSDTTAAPYAGGETNSDGSTVPSGDLFGNRTFTVSGGHISAYGGTHQLDETNGGALGDLIQVFPYDDTTNQGGVYILAICSLANGTPVTPQDCKYDAFKVAAGGGTCPDCGAPGAPLTIGKDAAGADVNTYTWSINKSVDKTKVEQIGGTATFTYTVTVSHDDGTVGGPYTVKGTITVTNPNASEVVGVDVTDSLSDGTICDVTSGTNATIDAGASPTFAYSCTLSVAPSGEIDNTATATWGLQTLDDGSILDAGHADFKYSNVTFTPKAADNCTTVTDPIPTGGTSSDNPFPTAGLKLCVGDTGDVGGTFTFVYSVTYNVPTHGCTSFTNTATESTDGKYKSVVVQVCGPAATGALTIGFWKTTNGQNLIKTYCGSTTTGLGHYLDGLGGAGTGPFGNAPTSCSALATYVSGILSGASATNMNNMLKAQMLGTALDVWFSGPGWTSTTLNKIKPPSSFLSHNSLGTFNMDTTAVCPMVDNTTAGTATCKLGLPSTDAVASGVVPTSPMSMQAILDFASTTPSPFNGSTSASNWYAGNKTKEEVLKNIFDQFNNGDAFGSF